MTTYYQIVLDDLSADVDEQEEEYMPPYDISATFQDKFNQTLKAISRAKRLQNRSLQLLNAYFLGQLLEKEAESLSQRGYYAQKLSQYYRITAIRTYYIFEVFSTRKIMKSLRTSLTTIRRLNAREFQDLVVRATIIFNGVENWEESDVTGSRD
jgi:hypothetical protein